MRRFEFVEGESSKFWEIAVQDSTLRVRYGRIGTQGQAKDKVCASAAAAQAEADKLIREKIGKGYAEGAGADLQAAPAPAPATRTPTPTPTPAPAAGPEPQPAGRFLWTPAWRKVLPPWRGEDFAAPPPLQRDAVIAEFTRRVAASQANSHAQFSLQRYAKAAGLALDAATFDPARLAQCSDPAHWTALLRLLMDFSFGYVERSALADAHALWQLCAVLHGWPFTLAALRAALAGRASISTDELSRWGLDELRARIAALDDATYAELRDETLAAGVSAVAGVIACLFPTESALVAPAVAVLPGATAGSAASLLMACRLDESQAQRVYASTAGWDHRWPTWRVLHLNLARLHHPQAAQIAIDACERQGAQDWKRAALDVVRAHDSLDALAAMLARVGDPVVRAQLDPFAHAWPQATIRLAAERLVGHEDQTLRDWLQRFVPVHRTALAAACAQADAAIRPLLDRLQQSLPAERPQVPLAELPEWLRTPAWRGRKGAAPADGAPARAPKLPHFWQPAAFAPPQLRDGRALPRAVRSRRSPRCSPSRRSNRATPASTGCARCARPPASGRFRLGAVPGLADTAGAPPNKRSLGLRRAGPPWRRRVRAASWRSWSAPGPPRAPARARRPGSKCSPRWARTSR
jgi:predicted DNA-binding WGR domain protein